MRYIYITPASAKKPSRMAAKAVVFKNLYHVLRLDQGDYDSYSEFVVCCESEEAARRTHPDDSGEVWLENETRFSTWINPGRLNEDLEVQFLGQAAIALKKGVICASFHAG